MIKYEDIEFSTIHSQEIIRDKLDKIVSNSTNLKKHFSGYVNLYNFEIHNKKSIMMYRTINYWKILIKGKMVNDNNLTKLNIKFRIFHGEIIYMYLFFIVLIIVLTIDGIKLIIPIIILGIIFILITLSTIIKVRSMDNEIKYYKELILKTIIE